jgi:hypothetical protein
MSVSAAPGPLARLSALLSAHPGVTIALGIAIAVGALVVNDRMVDAAPRSPELAAAVETDDGPDADPILDALAPIGIDAAEARTLVTALGRLPAGTPVWIAYPAVSPSAAAAAVALGYAFRQAGAVVRETRTLDYSVRPGLFVFAADESYPSFVDDVAHALGEAVPDVAVMSGYRAYGTEQRASDPSWQGLRMEDGESYFVVIGRVP